MKITTQQELDDLIATADKSNTIVLNEDLIIFFHCIISCNIKAHNIKARNINAYDIDAKNINAKNINADNINARNINAYDIDANNIKVCNIDAYNIKAGNIDAHNINAYDIKYYAFCIAYQSLKCKSILGRREKSFHKCLDQEIEIIYN